MQLNPVYRTSMFLFGGKSTLGSILLFERMVRYVQICFSLQKSDNPLYLSACIIGAGAKVYLTVTQMFHRVGLNLELSYAINNSGLHRVEMLLKAGAGPNAADDYDSLILAR